MKIAEPGRAVGLIFGRFRPRAVPLVAGALAATAALAVAGCSAFGGANAAGGAYESVSLSGSTTSNSAPIANGKAGGYQVLTLNDRSDITFNQLLGINNDGVIAGYFGSGNAGQPNKGYQLRPPFAQGDFGSENFPGSAQTQVTGLNDFGVTVGFFSTQNGATPADDNTSASGASTGDTTRSATRRVTTPTRRSTSCSASTTPAPRSGSTTTAPATRTATPTTSKPGGSS